MTSHPPKRFPGAATIVLILWTILFWLWITISINTSPKFARAYQLPFVKGLMHILDAACILAIAKRFTHTGTIANWLKDRGVLVNGSCLRTEVPLIFHAAIVGMGLYIMPWCVRLSFANWGRQPSSSFSAMDDLAILLLPAIEELVYRGCLYSAWRGGHSIPTSIMLTFVPVAVSHWSICVESLFNFLMLTATNAVFCLYREFCYSLWPSIACHTSYNACYLLVLHLDWRGFSFPNNPP
jgi:membrane protease YdiL (CAAX protease family)